MRWITLLLFVMLAAVQVDLWLGKASLPQVAALGKKLQAQQLVNQQAQARNDRTAAELRDLKDGEEMVEEKARAELGMVKKNEILVRLSERPNERPNDRQTGIGVGIPPSTTAR